MELDLDPTHTETYVVTGNVGGARPRILDDNGVAFFPDRFSVHLRRTVTVTAPEPWTATSWCIDRIHVWSGRRTAKWGSRVTPLHEAPAHLIAIARTIRDRAQTTGTPIKENAHA